MRWDRIESNWSELKGKAKKQIESYKDYNLNMQKNEIKQHAIHIDELNKMPPKEQISIL